MNQQPSSETPSGVSVLCLNTYLIPALFVNKDNATCKNQSSRATGIGKLISGFAGRSTSCKRSPAVSPVPESNGTGSGNGTARSSPPVASLAPSTTAPYDVVALQEVWGSSMSELETPVRSSYNVLPYCKSWGFSVLDTALQYANKRGGLWVAGKKETTECLYTRWMTYDMSNTSSKKGAVASLYKLGRATATSPPARSRRKKGERVPSTDSLADEEDQVPGGVGLGGLTHLLVVNTHVDPTNDNRMIERQLDQLERWLAVQIVQDKAFLRKIEEADPSSATAGGTLATIADSVGFLMIGDWNSPSKFVRQQMTGLDMTDLYDDCWARIKKPSSTVGSMLSGVMGSSTDRRYDATYDGTKNSLVMWKSERERIDIQFGIRQVTIPNSSAKVQFAPLEALDAEILYYPPGAELSDHYPVRLTIRKRVA